eukprot:m.378398 g.378398  ORF g.378398 m.378398 type:complete len:217 (-) comp56199_c0_seq1:182-832(-)
MQMLKFLRRLTGRSTDRNRDAQAPVPSNSRHTSSVSAIVPQVIPLEIAGIEGQSDDTDMQDIRLKKASSRNLWVAEESNTDTLPRKKSLRTELLDVSGEDLLMSDVDLLMAPHRSLDAAIESMRQDGRIGAFAIMQSPFNRTQFTIVINTGGRTGPDAPRVNDAELKPKQLAIRRTGERCFLTPDNTQYESLTHLVGANTRPGHRLPVKLTICCSN